MANISFIPVGLSHWILLALCSRKLLSPLTQSKWGSPYLTTCKWQIRIRTQICLILKTLLTTALHCFVSRIKVSATILTLRKPSIMLESEMTGNSLHPFIVPLEVLSSEPVTLVIQWESPVVLLKYKFLGPILDLFNQNFWDEARKLHF